MTQLSIKTGNFFICGPITKDLLEAEKEFSLKEEVLNSYGCNTVNQFLLFNDKGLQIENLKYTIMHMIGCNTLVTLPYWANCEFAKKQVEVARLLGLDIVDYSKLILHLTEKHSHA
jgi:hypothetical protein